MSTATRRPHAEALAIAREFASLFPSCYDRWQIAGSLRRHAPDVGDAEHLVIPTLGEHTPEGSLIPVAVSLLWKRMDDLLAAGTIEKALCGVTKQTRWGPKHRAALYKGMQQDVYTADNQNWGYQLTIRTGPEDFSHRMVTRLAEPGLVRGIEGYVRYTSGPVHGTVRPCATEEQFFEMCRTPWVEPEDRR